MYKELYDKLINSICKEYGFDRNKFEKTRNRLEMDCSHIARALISEYCKLTSSAVAKLFNRTHASILCSINNYREWIIYDEAFQQRGRTIQKLMDNINYSSSGKYYEIDDFYNYYAGA
jgi:hypothetical protein